MDIGLNQIECIINAVTNCKPIRDDVIHIKSLTYGKEKMNLKIFANTPLTVEAEFEWRKDGKAWVRMK
jgi:hypothetical protein